MRLTFSKCLKWLIIRVELLLEIKFQTKKIFLCLFSSSWSQSNHKNLKKMMHLWGSNLCALVYQICCFVMSYSSRSILNYYFKHKIFSTYCWIPGLSRSIWLQSSGIILIVSDKSGNVAFCRIRFGSYLNSWRAYGCALIC